MNTANLPRRAAAGQVALRMDDEEIRHGHTAVVVPDRAGVTADDVAAYCATHPNLRGMYRPRRIETVDALPRTGSGKLNPPELRKLFP